MDLKLLKLLIILITFHYQIFTILSLSTTNNGYLRADTVKLHNNLPINYEIADLNQLLNNSISKISRRYLVKFVQTFSNSKIFKYIKYDDSTSKIIISNKLNTNEICNLNTHSKQACSFNLQLIILNQNKFIEIPIEIVDDTKVIEISLNEDLNVGYKFIIELLTRRDQVIDKKINFKLEEEFVEYDEILRENKFIFKDSTTFRLLISTLLNNKLIAVLNKKLSHKEQNYYKLKLSSFDNDNEISSEYVLISVTSNTNSETISAEGTLQPTQLTPLEFENSTYSIEIPSNIKINTEILNIKLKNNFNDLISYSLVFDNEESISLIMENYFNIDKNNGIIKMISSIENLNIDFIKLKVKATYANILNNNMNDLNFSDNYFYNYLIPAFCDIKITVYAPTTTSTTTTKIDLPITTTTTFQTIITTTVSNQILTKSVPIISTIYQSRILNDLDYFEDIEISNFKDNLNTTGLNFTDCLTNYEINNKDINPLSIIKYQILNQSTYHTCFKNIEILNSGCLKIDFNDTCDAFDTDFKFKVCFLTETNEKCSKVYIQNLTYKTTDIIYKKNAVNLFIDYAQRSIFTSTNLFYGFSVAIVALFCILFSLVCWISRRKKSLIIKKPVKSHQESQEIEDEAKEFNFTSLVSAIKYKMMNTKAMDGKFFSVDVEKTIEAKHIDGCTLPKSDDKTPSIQVLDDCFQSRQNLTLQDAFKKQNFFSIYMNSSSPSVSSSEDYQSKFTRYLSLSKSSLENSSANTNEDKISTTEGVYSVKKASFENSDNNSTSTNYNINELSQIEKFQANKNYLNIINNDYNSMSTFNNIDVNNNYGQCYSKNYNISQKIPCTTNEDQKKFSLKQWKKEIAFKKSFQTNELINNTSNSSGFIQASSTAIDKHQMNLNYNIDDHKNYKLYEHGKSYCKNIKNNDGVVASIV